MPSDMAITISLFYPAKRKQGDLVGLSCSEREAQDILDWSRMDCRWASSHTQSVKTWRQKKLPFSNVYRKVQLSIIYPFAILLKYLKTFQNNDCCKLFYLRRWNMLVYWSSGSMINIASCVMFCWSLNTINICIAFLERSRQALSLSCYNFFLIVKIDSLSLQ